MIMTIVIDITNHVYYVVSITVILRKIIQAVVRVRFAKLFVFLILLSCYSAKNCEETSVFQPINSSCSKSLTDSA